MSDHAKGLALVLSGGGARAAYQVGFLSALAEQWPELRFSILTGVSAGAINAAHLAASPNSFRQTANELTEFWLRLNIDRVFRVDNPNLGRNVFRWGVRLLSGGSPAVPEVRGLVDTTPLREYLMGILSPSNGDLTGIGANLDQGKLRAFAVTATNYATGQTITWVEGRNVQNWERPNRRSVETRITLDHIMASAALPLFFPAIQIGEAWYGDGGIRQATPLSPAVNLGAERILAISTRYQRSVAEADVPVIQGYPPPIQILSVLMNAIFLDALDQDAHTLERINALLALAEGTPGRGLRTVKLFVLRPSCDLGKLAGRYEDQLPRMFRFLTRGLGTRETESPDWLSMVLFHRDYLEQLIEIGQADARAHRDEIEELLE
jgi:NTE family protein